MPVIFAYKQFKTLAAITLPLSVVLSGCVTIVPAVPKDYAGPVAIIKDSKEKLSESKTNFYYVSEIDGKRIEDSRAKTISLNQGCGLIMIPSVIERNVPAQEATFTLVARTEYGAPILAWTNPVYQVIGKVTFSPETYRSYVVRGELGENYSAVWLEDEVTGKVIGKKIEVDGPSILGIYEL